MHPDEIARGEAKTAEVGDELGAGARKHHVPAPNMRFKSIAP
jgi:hypothetical protein